MIIIEVFAPRDVLDPDHRERLASRLLAAVGQGAASVQVLVHEPDVWLTGADAEPAAPGRWLVRVSLPAAWRDAMAKDGTLIATITQVLAETAGDDPRRLYRRPDAWVQLVDVPDGAFGTLGEPLDAADLADLATGSLEVASDGGILRTAPAPGTVRDPICGMIVDLSRTKLVVDHEGTTYGFCAPVCRDQFIEQQVTVA